MSLLPKMAIIYASGLGRTRLMAESIAEGAKTVSGIEILLKEVPYAIPDDVKDADAILLGGSTYNHKLIESMNAYLGSLGKLDLKGKLGLAFGSYGWSG
ncbi:MAG TPA: flavodoxin domain-containing protein, partial [Methanotrichaceae archaeon]|nr:flavodoxin domain-containing protein [Methanotrichaceae archaeon]